MEGLLVVLAIVAAIAQFAKLFKKNTGTNQKQAPKTEAPANPTPPPKPKTASVWDQIQEMMTETGGESEGEDEADAAGCVGGSIPHEQHEGLTPSGSLNGATILEQDLAAGSGSLGGYTPLTARPVMSPRREGAPGSVAASTAKPASSARASGVAAARYTPSDMQRAVVMAELLGRPVSMRRRREVGAR